MIQPVLLQPSWPYYDNINSPLDCEGDFKFGMDADMGDFEFSPPFTTSEDSPDNAFSIPYLATVFSDECMDFPVHVDELDVTLPTDDFSLDLKEFDPIWSGEIGGMSRALEESEEIFLFHQLPIAGEDDEWGLSHYTNSIDTLMDVTSIQSSLTLPTEDMEIDNQLSVVHLVMAYGEAMEKEQTELAEVIVKCISEKVSPVGEIMERLLFYLFQHLDKQSDYLKQESGKNFYAAFKAFYQIFPNGKFAHFAANLAILEAMPDDAEIIHIFDFDMGDGIQWSAMIEAFGRQQKEVRLTSIKWNEGDSNCIPSLWKFEETKRRLYDHARSFGLKLKVEEMELNNLMNEIKKMKISGGRSAWFAFNCMNELPHMGRVRSRRDVMEFLRLAKEFLSHTPSCNTSYRGILTFGDGDAWEKFKNSSSFGSFWEGYLVHYQALLESMECNFPIHLAEARTALECLFVAPFVSSLDWIRKWEETKECCDLQSGIELEGWKVSKESLMEAKEMVRDRESLYRVRIEGENNNEMIMEWSGIPLVKISCWENKGEKKKIH